ncbi:MAG: DUF169 domain-containing protein [Desulfobacteraceae bacterium]|nr:DUF169 domain-containing protein [Desulfobacteraceae bacterium]
MQPDPAILLETAQITTPPIGLYDTPDNDQFQSLTRPNFCLFSSYPDWLKGKSTLITKKSSSSMGCPGIGYWLCNKPSVPRESMAQYLAGQEGLKASPDLICRWLESQPPFQGEYDHVVIGPLKPSQYSFLKTITFFVKPDQLSLLITGAEYQTSGAKNSAVAAIWGSGCGQLAAVFNDFTRPQAMISGTDIAMRSYLPYDTLAFTVTKPMFEQLCSLDSKSFFYKSFWKAVKTARNQRT